MPIAIELAKLLRAGVHRLGELEIQTTASSPCFKLCHWQDAERLREGADGGLEAHSGPAAARELSLYAEDGEYRFAKGQMNLRRGWMLGLRDEEELRQALDQFYPAAVGLYLAQQQGTLEVEHLRDKLGRQSGMYRQARAISDAGAQQLVREVCGPAHQCAKRILWQLDATTPLKYSEASRFNGISGALPAGEAIPLLCREACNHLVAECRRVAKAEASPS